MKLDAPIGNGQFSLIAIIPIITKKNMKVSWVSDKKGLLSVVIDKVLSESAIKKIVIVANDASMLACHVIDKKIDVIDKSNILTNKGEFNSSPFAIAGKVFGILQKQAGGKVEFNGLMVIDPFRYISGTSYIKDAINLYTSQSGKSRPWNTVISVSELPNHFHPKKIVCISEEGFLQYYKKEGARVYRRQQIEDDIYYAGNGAVHLFDPMLINKTVRIENTMLGYVINETIAVIREENQLGLVSALNPV